MFKKLNERKRRLYMAFYRRQAHDGGVIFHTSLLICPKRPDLKSGMKSALALHVVNKVSVVGVKGYPNHASTSEPESKRYGKSVWKYAPEKKMPRTRMLQGLVLLAKVPDNRTDEHLTELLGAIQYPEDEEQDPTWRCRNWVWEAIDILNREGIISEDVPDGITGQDLWQRAYDYFKERQITLDNPDAPVHTVDIQLQQLESEIGPLQ